MCCGVPLRLCVVNIKRYTQNKDSSIVPDESLNAELKNSVGGALSPESFALIFRFLNWK